MNKKSLTLAIVLSLMTTTALAAPSPEVRESGKVKAAQARAVEYAQEYVARKLADDGIAANRMVVDVNDAVKLALANNRTVKNAQWSYKQAAAAVSQAAAAKNPKITYSYSGSRGESTGASIISESSGNGVALSLPIYTGGSAEASLAAARYAREGAGAYVTQIEQETKLTTATNYYTLIMARNQADIARQTVRDLEGHLENVNQQFNVGIVAKADVLASSTSLANARTTLLQAENAADLAEASLNNVMGLPVGTGIETEDKELGYAPYGVTLNQANTYAILHRAELIRTAMSVKSAEANVRSARGGYLPTVSVTAGRNWASLEWNAGTDNKGWTVGAGVSMSLWDGGSTQSAVNIAKAQLEAAKETNFQQMDTILLEVRQAYLNMKSAEQTIESTRTAVEEGQENFRIASLRYRAGVGTNLDVLDAEVSLETARNNYVSALYNYNTYVSALEKAMGVPVPTPVAQGEPIVVNSGSEAEAAVLVERVLR